MKQKILLNKILIAVALVLTPFVINRININGIDKIIFINVGQGDATIVCTSYKICGLIDTGKRASIIDQIKKYTPYPLAFILITHPDADHFAQTIPITQVIGTNRLFIGNTSKALDTLKAAQENGIAVYDIRDNNDFKIGNFFFDVIWPEAGSRINTLDSNDSSISIVLTSHNKKFVLAGDLGAKYENLLTQRYKLNSIDVLKLSHHGSKNSSSIDFLSTVMPKIAIISVGKNSYGHPSPLVLENLSKLNVPYLRTDQTGDIEFQLNNENTQIYSENTKNSYIILN